MSHVVQTGVYELNVDKKKVQEFWDVYAAHDDWQEGCCGLNGAIRWINHTCEDYKSAMEYIDAHDRGWYDQLAVMFKEHKNVKPSKKYEDICRMIEETSNKKSAFINEISPKNMKQAQIGCKRCGSKLATAYLNGFGCPVCGNDMMSESARTRIKGYEDKLKELRKREREEELKQKNASSKYEVKWLVKVEWHV